ncbi:hypothetical protein T06_2249 [Trichinella sp. T6]|nr:hypothetical protein T06_2249 [Trichinella sp. T6]
MVCNEKFDVQIGGRVRASVSRGGAWTGIANAIPNPKAVELTSGSELQSRNRPANVAPLTGTKVLARDKVTDRRSQTEQSFQFYQADNYIAALIRD